MSFGQTTTASATQKVGLAIFPYYAPREAWQSDVCAIVELKEGLQKVKLEATDAYKKASQATVLKYTVKVIASSELEQDKEYECYSKADKTLSVPASSKRFLLLGWKPTGSDKLGIDFAPGKENVLWERHTIACTERSVFAQILIPTEAKDVVNAIGLPARAYANIAECLKGTPPDSVIRRATSSFSLAVGSSRDDGIVASKYPEVWVPALLNTMIKKLTKDSALKELRYEGLCATWEGGPRALTFVRSLPAILKKLGLDKELKPDEDSKDDMGFIGTLGILKLVSPDEVFALAKENAVLTYFVLSPEIGKPSLENQKWLLGMLSNPSADVRGLVLGKFSTWYSEWDKYTTAKWSDEAQGVVVPREQELTEYWRNKILGPDKP